MKSWLERISDLIREHAVIAVILFLAFVLRLFLADANSYWLDELYSVVVYGIDNATSVEAIKRLTRSIHPPLYQFILYHWMTLFGDSEVATRSLSNLYVTGSTLCLYALTFKLYGRRVAITAALVLSLMYMPFYYGLETRSYAQTLFLGSLSSLCLFYFLDGLRGSLRWLALLRTWRFAALVVVNFALLMTHYYNVFFLGAQGVFVLAFLLLKTSGRNTLSTVAKAVVISITPLLLLLVSWGAVMAASYERMKGKGRYVTDIITAKDPFSVFFGLVVEPNLVYPALILGLAGLLLLPRLLRAGRCIYPGDARLGVYFDFYFLVALLLPFALAYLLFMIAGHERYSARYFVFCAPSLAVLLVLSLEEIVHVIGWLASRLGFRSTGKYRQLALAVVALISVLIVLPSGYAAATRQKADWRGTARTIVNLVDSEPNKTFIVYETTFRKFPTLDYYLSRFSKTLRVKNHVQRLHERRGTAAARLESLAEEIGEADYLVLAFTHHRAKNFTNTRAYLASNYTVHFTALDRVGRGFIVYKIR